MKKLFYSVMIGLTALSIYSCSKDDNNVQPEPAPAPPVVSPEELARQDSIRRADSIAAAIKHYNDSMQNVYDISLPILKYGKSYEQITALETRELLRDTTWTISGTLGGDFWKMTRRELDYAESRPQAISFQVMYLFQYDDYDQSEFTEAYMAVERDRGKQLYDFMRWGFQSMGSDGGKDYYITKDSLNYIYIRDMNVINPEYDYYFINFRPTSPEEILYFFGSPAKKRSKVSPTDQVMLELAKKLRK